MKKYYIYWFDKGLQKGISNTNKRYVSQYAVANCDPAETIPVIKEFITEYLKAEKEVFLGGIEEEIKQESKPSTNKNSTIENKIMSLLDDYGSPDFSGD